MSLGPCSVFVLEMHHVNPLTGMPCSDVRHHVGRLLATELAIRTLEPGRLTALVFQVPGHVALDGEASSALGATERFPEALGERSLGVSVPRAGLSIVIRQRPRRRRRATGIALANFPTVAALVLERLARL